ncbi:MULTISPECIES: CHAT domain-containing protein [unclassified Microcoleus]|uniref:CHAT domain-containing protein n=1 Tax=unclassified Microcoleus TaxID=2642155 RepID=UPI002FD64E2A
MNEERHQSYLNLINLLLTCTQGQEIEILQAHPDLHDARLVMTMLQVASDLIKQNHFNNANQLMNIVGLRLGVYCHSLTISKREESDRLFDHGEQQFQEGQLDVALQLWQQALAIDWVMGNRRGEGACLNSLGRAYYSQGEYKKAIACLQQAVAIARDIGYCEGEVKSLSFLGCASGSIGQYHKAIKYHQAALKLFQDIGNYKEEVHIYNNLGNTYRYLGEYLLARTYNIKSLVASRKIKDSKLKAASLANLGLTLEASGKYKKAIKYHKQSLEIARTVKDYTLEAAALGNLGCVYKSLGEYQKAIEYQQQDLEIAINNKDRKLESGALDNLGIIYYVCGEYKQAIEYNQKSLGISKEIGDRQGQSNSLINLGLSYQALKQFQQGLECYQLALSLKQEIGDRKGEAICLGNLGNYYYFINQYEKAIEYYQQDLNIVKEIGYCQGEADALSVLGSAYQALGDIDLSLNYYHQSLLITKKIGDLSGIGTCLNNIGAALFSLSILEEAKTTFYQAIDVWESLRFDLKYPQKISIFERQSTSYRQLQEVLVALNRQEEALEIAERGRTRAFVELLIKRLFEADTKPNVIDCLSSQKIQEIADNINYTLVEYSIVDSGMKLLIWVVNPTGGINFSQKDIKSLQQKNTSLFKLVIKARESLGIIESHHDASIPASPAPQLNANLTYPQLHQLYQILIEPIAHLLHTRSNTPVVFIPQDILLLVPFSSLQDSEGKFLIEKHTVLTAPSIQVLELIQKRSIEAQETPLEALVVGNPWMPTIPLTEPPLQLQELPWSGTEAKAIAPLLQTQPITGAAATKVNVVEQMPKARLIHLATHGLLDDIRQLGVPGAIALAPSDGDNGFLTAGEIYNMKLNAELVVLSACSTGQGKITGDGVIGLSRCLIAAGVKSVIVSLWSVGDLSTAFLMVKFYQIFQQGVVASIALNEAQRWLLEVTKMELEDWIEANRSILSPTLRMGLRRRLHQLDDNSKPFQHPRHWAAFSAIGQ